MFNVMTGYDIGHDRVKRPLYILYIYRGAYLPIYDSHMTGVMVS